MLDSDKQEHRMVFRVAAVVFSAGALLGCGNGTQREFSTAAELNSRETHTAATSQNTEAATPEDAAGSLESNNAPSLQTKPSTGITPISAAVVVSDQAIDGTEGGTDRSEPDPKMTQVANADSSPSSDFTVSSSEEDDGTANPSNAKPKLGEDGYPVAYHEMPSWLPEGPQSAIRVSFDDLDLLKLMNAEPVPLDVEKTLPPRITSLEGRRIRIRGFMMPPFATSGLTGFIMARDNELCCFGREPKVYDLIPVKLREGQTTRYIQMRPFDVVGVLHIIPDIELMELYYIDDAVVIE